MEAKDRIIVALDVDNPGTARSYAQELAPYVGPFKVGLELITAGLAPAVIQNIRAAGGQVFYDGKFNDIPNTVAAASREATRLGVAMLNIHCTSGPEALEAAVKAVAGEDSQTGKRPLVLGVTILTSLDKAALMKTGYLPSYLCLPGDADRITQFGHPQITDKVVQLATLAKESGLDGVIASPLEIEAIRQACSSDFLIVTPGVRPAGAAVGDQKRVMTPGEAIKAGADYLVIGRPILKPESGTRVEAALRIAEEISSAL